MQGRALLRAVAIGLPLAAIPTAMGVGLLRAGPWTMMSWGAAAAAVVLFLRLGTTTGLECWLARACPFSPSAPEVDELAGRTGVGSPRLLRLPPGARPSIFTTSWRRRAPVLFVSADLLVEPGLPADSPGTATARPALHPDALGAVAHELCHVRTRDVLWKHFALVTSIFALSLSLVSPLAAVRDVLARATLAELFAVMCAPLATWIGVTQYSALARWLELRADRNATAVCSAADLERSIRRLAEPTHGWLFATHPSRAERLARLHQLGALHPRRAGST